MKRSLINSKLRFWLDKRMKNKMHILLIVFISLTFVSCSNMTIGLEEESPFYNGPIIDTRASAESDKVRESDSVRVVKEPEVQNEVVTSAKLTQSPETPREIKKEELQNQENETTFSYERDDD